MDVNQITDEVFLETFRDVVRDMGEDYQYPFKTAGDDDYRRYGAAVYRKPDGSPACIIGHILYRLNPDIVPTYSECAYPAALVLRVFCPGLTRSFINAAQEAQEASDLSVRWGDILATFEQEVSRG